MTESLWGLKTHSDIAGPKEALWPRKVRTLQSLSGIEEATPYELDERELQQKFREDRKMLARQTNAVQKSRARLLEMRSKLKAVKERNKRIQEHRRQLMAERRAREKKMGSRQRNRQQRRGKTSDKFVIEY